MRPSWPPIVLMHLFLTVSQIYSSPVCVPTAKRPPSLDHYTLVTRLLGPMSLNLVTLLFIADQR